MLIGLVIMCLASFDCSSSSGDSGSPPADAGDAAPASDAGEATDVTSFDGGGGGGDGEAGVLCTDDHTQRFVTNQILLPLQRSDYAIDLNGDGHVDNQLGNVIGALAGQNLDSQAAMNAAVAAGDALLLVDETSNDAAFAADPSCGRAGAQQAAAHASPDFTGSGTFTPDGASMRGAFGGAIAGGLFDATQPASMTTPVELDVKLAIGPGLVKLHVVGAHLSFTYASGKLTGGKLQGVVRAADVTNVVVPTLASELNDDVQTDPSSDQSKQLLQIFDVGGCTAGSTNFDGTTAASNDGKIAVCEVAGSSIVSSVLAPDVQMFDAAGNYHPNPANTTHDAFSLAVAFTAVGATF